jgi:hypothetical protein
MMHASCSRSRKAARTDPNGVIIDSQAGQVQAADRCWVKNPASEATLFVECCRYDGEEGGIMA